MRALLIGEVKGYLRHALAAALLGHSRAHFAAELDWTRDLLDRVEQGIYP